MVYYFLQLCRLARLIWTNVIEAEVTHGAVIHWEHIQNDFSSSGACPFHWLLIIQASGGWLKEGQDQSTDAYQVPIAPLTKSSHMSVVSVGSSMDPERLVHWSSSI